MCKSKIKLKNNIQYVPVQNKEMVAYFFRYISCTQVRFEWLHVYLLLNCKNSFLLILFISFIPIQQVTLGKIMSIDWGRWENNEYDITL